jgi:hypothetical protein
LGCGMTVACILALGFLVLLAVLGIGAVKDLFHLAPRLTPTP